MTTTTETRAETPEENRQGWIRAALIGAGMALVGCIMAIGFLLPLTNVEAKDVALGVAGPDQAVSAMADKLESQQQGVFDITPYADRDEAVDAIKTREVAGAIVIGQDGTEFLTASGGAAQVNQLLTQMASGMTVQAAQTGGTVTTTDIVPATGNSSALNMVVIAALMPGLAGSMVGFMAVKKAWRRFAVLISAGVTSGLIGGLVLGPWFDVLQGNFWLDSLAIGLSTMAIGGIITGLAALFGGAGLAVGALTIMLFANPWSGNMAPTEFLPSPWGTIGSWMPNGTLIDLVRVLSFFPEASTADHWWRLIGWIAFGFVCLAVGAYLQPAKEARKAEKEAEKKAAEEAEKDQAEVDA